MRRMYSENQIAELVKKNPQAVVKALEGQDINVEGITSKGIANTGNIANTGDIATSGSFFSGGKNLDSKYVKIIPAPESTTLTDEQIELITKGVFVEGTFLSYVNPVFFPAYSGVNNYFGFFAGVTQYGVGIIVAYTINKSTKVISSQGNTFQINGPGNAIEMNGNVNIKGKSLPTNPSDTGAFTLKMVNGTLTWVEEI